MNIALKMERNCILLDQSCCNDWCSFARITFFAWKSEKKWVIVNCGNYGKGVIQRKKLWKSKVNLFQNAMLLVKFLARKNLVVPWKISNYVWTTFQEIESEWIATKSRNLWILPQLTIHTKKNRWAKEKGNILLKEICINKNIVFMKEM